MNLFKGPSPPPQPTPTATLPLPDQTDPAIMADRRRQLALAVGRRGQASTVLSPTDDYSGTKTGVT